MLRSLKIAPRLSVGFGFILVASALLVAVGSYGLTETRQGVQSITSLLLPTAKRMAQTNLLLTRSKVAMATMTASIADQGRMTQTLTDWEQAQTEISKTLDEVRVLTAGTAFEADVKKLDEPILAYRQAGRPVLDKLLAKAYPDASAALEDSRLAETSHAAAMERLTKIETDLNVNAGSVFQSVDALVSRVLLGFWLTFLVCAVAAVLLAIGLSKSIIGPIQEAKRHAEEMSAGDLTDTPPVAGRDEAVELMRALATMRASLSAIVGQVRDSAQSILLASGEVAVGNLDLSQRTEQTASSLQGASSAMTELSSKVSQSAESAATARQLAGTASDTASRGGEVVSRVVNTMGEINLASKKIADIIVMKVRCMSKGPEPATRQVAMLSSPCTLTGA